MLPLVLAPPKNKPARVLGLGREALPAVQGLMRVSWPLIVHDPEGAKGLAALPTVQVSRGAPDGGALRQASLVLVTSACPKEWRADAELALKGSGVPVWDSRNPAASTLGVPAWFPGSTVSMAVWGNQTLEPWESALTEDLARSCESLFSLFLKLAGELRSLVFSGLTDEAFRQKVVGQITKPEILALLLKGDYEGAKVLSLKIVGSTTRALE
jgi:hypothetical protein